MKNEGRKRALKRIFFIVTVTVCFVLLSVSVFASDEKMPDGYGDLIESLPNDVCDRLPGGMFSDDPDDVGEAISEMTDTRFIIGFIEEVVSRELCSSVMLFVKLCGFLIIAAIFNSLQRSLCSESLASAVSFCTTTAIFASIIYIEAEHLSAVSLFFERLTALMSAMIPITGTVWAMGGNITTASVGTSALYLFVSFCEGIIAKSVVPVCCVFTAFSLCNTIAPEIGLRGFSGALKKIYGFFLGLMMTVLIASLASGTALSAARDCTSARAAKLVSSNVIPMVGASIGDTLRTIASSVQYLKTVIGIGGIIFICLLLLPTLISLIMTRLAFLLSSGVAEMLGCPVEGRFLSELGGVYAIMVAVVSVSSVMFIFALTIFAKTLVALT